MTDEVQSGTQTRSSAAPRGGALQTAATHGRTQSHASLATEHGKTEIADQVVAKIAGWAAREIPGVYDMGKGLARTIGGIRSRVPGQTDSDSATQGVSVEVGERQCAVDLDLVTVYGESIVDVSQAVRNNVIDRIQTMTGLEVKEVNIRIDDLFVDGIETEPVGTEPRVE